MNENVWQALLFSAIAGLSTGIGSLIALFAKKSYRPSSCLADDPL